MAFKLGVDKVIKELSKKSHKSRAYNVLLNRLQKKLDRLKRYTRTRTHEKSLEVLEELEAGYEATIPEDMAKVMKTTP